jgi:predicted  nucleic acid-binding Zn-ribbon protein
MLDILILALAILTVADAIKSKDRNTHAELNRMDFDHKIKQAQTVREALADLSTAEEEEHKQLDELNETLRKQAEKLRELNGRRSDTFHERKGRRIEILRTRAIIKSNLDRLAYDKRWWGMQLGPNPPGIIKSFLKLKL